MKTSFIPSLNFGGEPKMPSPSRPKHQLPTTCSSPNPGSCTGRRKPDPKYQDRLPGTPLQNLRPGSGFCFERGGWAYIRTNRETRNYVRVVQISSGALTYRPANSRVFPLEIEIQSTH